MTLKEKWIVLSFKDVEIPLYPRLTIPYILTVEYDDLEKAIEHAKLRKADGWEVIIVKGFKI